MKSPRVIEPIRLDRAIYCADCQCITETSGKMYCEYCKSGAIVWLQHLLDGPNGVWEPSVASSQESQSHSATG